MSYQGFRDGLRSVPTSGAEWCGPRRSSGCRLRQSSSRVWHHRGRHRILRRCMRESAFSQSRLHSAKLKQAWLCAHWHEMSRKKSTMASRVVDLISCMGGVGVKGLNKRFCIRVPDSVRPWGRGSRRRCGGIR